VLVDTVGTISGVITVAIAIHTRRGVRPATQRGPGAPGPRRRTAAGRRPEAGQGRGPRDHGYGVPAQGTSPIGRMHSTQSRSAPLRTTASRRSAGFCHRSRVLRDEPRRGRRNPPVPTAGASQDLRAHRPRSSPPT
jgi:hypothetical protein